MSRVEQCVEAFKSGKKQMAEQLLPSIIPADVWTTFDFWYYHGVVMVSLLHLAAYWGWKDLAIILVPVYIPARDRHECVANLKDSKGHTPLHYAAHNGHLEVVKYFITELLCDPMDRNRRGDTPLHMACHRGHLNIIQYLISELHCNPSCVGYLGWTPLHYACREYTHVPVHTV